MYHPNPDENQRIIFMFKKIRQSRMYEEIVNQVLESTMRGDLEPGDKLPSENQLSKTFGVSRVTVREAIRSLEQYGVIEVRQGSMGGAYIRQVDIDSVLSQVRNALRLTNVSVQQLTEARIILEEMIIGKLLPLRAGAIDFSVLEENIAAAEDHYRNKRNEERLRTNFRFHAILSEMTQNPIIILMHKIIIDMLFQFFKNVKPSVPMIQKTFKNHKRLVELLKKSDFAAASDRAAQNIREVHQRIVEKSKKQSLIGN